MHHPLTYSQRLTQPGIHIHALALRYGNRVIFQNLNLDIAPGRFTMLLGPSGVGKTSLLKLVAGLLIPSQGQILATDGAPLAGRIAYMAQADILFPWLSLIQNTMLGARLRAEKPDAARAETLLESVGLAGRAKDLPATLSGGMRQRAAIARTLYENRPMVLMDEPFTGLDVDTRARLQNLAATTLAGRTVLMITHDPLEALRLGHHIIIMQGTPATLTHITPPQSPIPRATDDPGLLQSQATLLRLLTAA
jgi:putative hydroxymethylpyrimidine transport system ATP-binding protein